jgi:TolB-like protein/class 3 adenylate cyclase/cytochrome c-type biogenesis protein CcmH/NrfG
MAEEGFKRKLTAILSADVIGYSRLMRDDEEATVRDIAAHRVLISDIIKQHNGRVVDSPGDNILAEFASVVDAVNGAIKIQEEIKKTNADVPQDRRMEFRNGINLGDVIEEDERIYGDGVNIAARVEGLAAGGGIAISGTVYEHIKEKLSLGYHYLGEQDVKNIPEPVRVYRLLTDPADAGKLIGEEKTKSNKLLWAAAAAFVLIILGLCTITIKNYYFRPSFEPASAEKMAFPLPDKPSIAVLPFDNMSGDPEDEYIADGITEDIITAISKIDAMFVIARNSTFTYKGTPVKIKQVSEEFGVQYVLEGSIQRSGDRLRVTAQLIDALTGRHLWADRYDRKLKDLFDFKDEITKEVITELHVEITDGEQAQLFSKETDSFEAWLHNSKGVTYLDDWTKRENNVRARAQFEKAVKIDPNFASAWTGSAITHMIDAMLGWTDNPAESFRQFFELNQKAISLDPFSPVAHNALGRVYMQQGQFEKAIAEGEKAISLEPNNSMFHADLSRIMQAVGRSEEAVELVKKAMRLSPVYDVTYLQLMGNYLHCAGRYEEAITAYEQVIGRHKMTGEFSPLWPHLGLTASYLELGQTDSAQQHYKKALALDHNIAFFAWAKVALRYKDKDFERLKSRFEPLRIMHADTDIKTKQYVHEGSPAFIFEYPEGSKDLPLTGPEQIIRMQTPKEVEFYASSIDIPEGMKLKDVGTKVYLPLLKEYGVGTHFDLISNDLITLKDGTKAYKTTINWLLQDGRTWITTLVVSAYKEDKYVFLDIHTAGDPEEVAWIVESLRFE